MNSVFALGLSLWEELGGGDLLPQDSQKSRQLQSIWGCDQLILTVCCKGKKHLSFNWWNKYFIVTDGPREKGRKNRLQLHILVRVLCVTATPHVSPACCFLFLYIPAMLRVTAQNFKASN